MTSTTLSGRFDDKELEVLKRAADQRKWSLAQLIRAGAYEKAVNIVNSVGERSYAVRRLIARIVEQLIQPNLFFTYLDQQDSEVSADERARLVELKNESEGRNDLGGGAPIEDLSCSKLDPAEVERLALAIRALGSELGNIVLDELQRAVHTETAMDALIIPETLSTDPDIASDSESSAESVDDGQHGSEGVVHSPAQGAGPTNRVSRKTTRSRRPRARPGGAEGE